MTELLRLYTEYKILVQCDHLAQMSEGQPDRSSSIKVLCAPDAVSNRACNQWSMYGIRHHDCERLWWCTESNVVSSAGTRIDIKHRKTFPRCCLVLWLPPTTLSCTWPQVRTSCRWVCLLCVGCMLFLTHWKKNLRAWYLPCTVTTVRFPTSCIHRPLTQLSMLKKWGIFSIPKHSSIDPLGVHLLLWNSSSNFQLR